MQRKKRRLYRGEYHGGDFWSDRRDISRPERWRGMRQGQYHDPIGLFPRRLTRGWTCTTEPEDGKNSATRDQSLRNLKEIT